MPWLGISDFCWQQKKNKYPQRDCLKHSVDLHLHNSLADANDSTEDIILDIPVKNNGEKYKVEDLSSEQFTIAVVVIDSV